MPKRTVIATALGAATGALLGLSTVSAAPLIEDEVLQVGVDLTYPPHEFMDPANTPAGFDVEFITATAMAASLSVKSLDTRLENSASGSAATSSTLSLRRSHQTGAREADRLVLYVKSGASIAAGATATRKPEMPEDLCWLKVSSIKAAA